MKKILSAALAVLMIFALASCGTSKSQLEELQSKYETLQVDYKKLQDEYNELSAGAAEWLKYSEDERAAKLAQAEADRIVAEEAEKKAEEEQEAIQKAAEEEAARLAAEEAKKGYDTGITFSNLERNPDDYEGKKVKLTGRVIQVMESDNEVDLRVATSKAMYGEGYGYDDVFYAYILNADATKEKLPSRILEDDVITIYGTSEGLYTYTSTADIDITLPLVSVDRVEFISMS